MMSGRLAGDRQLPARASSYGSHHFAGGCHKTAMIDWPMVGRNALWITGLAIALAAASYNDWWRSLHGESWRHTWNTPRFLAPFNGGLALFSVGLALSSGRWWEIALWAALSLAFVVQAIVYWRAGVLMGWDSEPGGAPQEAEYQGEAQEESE